MTDQRRRFKTTSFVIAMVLAAGCSSQSADQQIKAAKTALARHDLATALISAKSALQLDPNSGEARLLLGEVMIRADDGKSALVEFAKARELHVDADRLQALEAEALLKTGNPAAAIAKIGDIRDKKPREAAVLYVLLAHAAALQKRLDAVDASLAEARRLDPSYLPAILFEARRMADAGKQVDALKSIDAVLAKDANSEEALLLKGELALHAIPANLEAATAAFGQILKFRANSVPANAGLMDTVISRNDIDAIKAQYKLMVKALPQHPLTFLYGAEIALLEGNVTTAREQIQPLIKNVGEDFKVLTLAGAIETRGRAYPLGEAYLRKALLLSPASPIASRLLAQNLLASGQPAKTLALLEPLIEKSTSDSQTYALAGEASLALRDIPKALKYFARTAELDPNNSRARAALALGQFHRGHPTEAITALSTMAKSTTDDFADLALIALHMSRNDFDAASSAVTDLERKRPGSAVVPQMQGQISLGRNDLKAARTFFAKAIERDGGYFAAVAALAHIELDAGSSEGAQKLLKDYLKPDVDNLLARAWLIELRARGGALRPELDTLINDLVKRHPGEAVPRVLLVNHLLAFGEIKPALAAAQQAAAAVPDQPDVLDALGRTQAAVHDYGQAIGTFKRLISSNPKLPMVYVHLADVQLASGDVDSAIYNLRRAVNLAPQLASAQRGLFQLLARKARYPEAMAIARQMQAQPSSRLSGYLLAGELETMRQNWSSAVAIYRAGMIVEPASELAIGLRNALHASGKTVEAQGFATEWQNKYPKDNVFAYAQGEWAAKDGNWTAAESQFRRALELQPNSAASMNNLAFVLMKLGKPESVAMAERAQKLSPGSSQLLDTLAMTYSAQGRHEDAKATQRRAISIAPQDSMLKLGLVRILAAAGDKAGARRELEALSLKPDARLAKIDLPALMATLRD